MPDFFSSPYADAAQGFNQLGGTLQDVLVDLNRQRFQQQYQQQALDLRRQQLYQRNQADSARAALYKAQEALAKTRQKDLERAASAREGLETALWSTQMANAPSLLPSERPDATPYMARAIGHAAQLSDAARSHIFENLAQSLQMGDPMMQQLIATGGKPNEVVPRGSTLFNVPAGRSLYRAPLTLGTGQQAYDEENKLIASGPERLPTAVADTSLQRQLATEGNIHSSLMNQGQVPEEGSPSFPMYQSTTNRIAQLRRQLEGKGEGNVLPLPKSKEQLVVGKKYQTNRGPATWNGTKFIQ